MGALERLAEQHLMQLSKLRPLVPAVLAGKLFRPALPAAAGHFQPPAPAPLISTKMVLSMVLIWAHCLQAGRGRSSQIGAMES